MRCVVRSLAIVCVFALTGCSGVTAATDLQAEVRKHDIVLMPEGPGPFPAVLMLHGCGGLGSRDRMWAERLRAWGIVTLRLNSLAPRGLTSVCGGGSLQPNDRVPDVIEALAVLRARPGVDPSRIGMMGWSHGASTVLATLAALPADTPPVRGAIAFYPGCRQATSWKAHVPLLMLLGGADEWAPAGYCQGLANRQERAGFSVEAITYAGARHGFDNPQLASARWIPEALGGRGVWMQYDPAGAEDSIERVQEFWARVLQSGRSGQ